MIKILMLDDHNLIIEAISSFLEKESNINIVDKTTNIEEASKILDEKDVDILLSDINLSSSENGIQFFQRLKQTHTDVKVVFLTMYNGIELIKEAFDSGASGYLLKTTNIEEIKTALNKVYQGENYFSNEVANTYMNEVNFIKKENTHSLTQRQQQILSLICSGKKSLDIANELNISKHTVEAHKRMMVDKLNLSGAKELLKYAIEMKKDKHFDL